MSDAVLDPDREELEVTATPSPTPIPDRQAFRLVGDPPHVMRLSRKALAVLGMVAGLGIGGSLLYALQSRQPAPPQDLYDTSSRNRAETVTAAPATYDKVPKLGPALPGDLGRPILSAQENGQMAAMPAIGSEAAQPDPRMAAIERGGRERVGQERDAARISRLFLGGSEGAAVTPAAPLDGATIAHDGNAPEATDDTASGGQSGKRAFLESRSNRTPVSVERITAPVSAHILQAGSVIPAALITGIRSDLPGQITAQVTQNVYDSPTGRILLIPQGARLVGEYDSEIAAGQTRVLLAWDRLILPGGRSILLDRQPGADATGMAGLQDGTNYHWGNMFKAAAISTLLGVGTEVSTSSDDALTRALRSGTEDTINQTGRQVVQRQLNVSPTLSIRPGTLLRVIIIRDLVFH
jgi:type IV secretion system protein TrbI